jgi:lipid-A-disaccharide synthase
MIARRLVTVRHAALVNLLADLQGHEALGHDALVPELIQADCTPDKLAAALGRLLTDPAAVQSQRAGYRKVLDRLRPPGGLLPSEAAADAVIRLIEQP